MCFVSCVAPLCAAYPNKQLRIFLAGGTKQPSDLNTIYCQRLEADGAWLEALRGKLVNKGKAVAATGAGGSNLGSGGVGSSLFDEENDHL